MYFSTQPMEVGSLKALENTFKMINAETRLPYSSDYPHRGFDLPGIVQDPPFLSEKAKRRIFGENARDLFNLSKRARAQTTATERSTMPRLLDRKIALRPASPSPSDRY